MRFLPFLFLIAFISPVSAQEKWFSNQAVIAFISETDLLTIAGKNSRVVAFLKPSVNEMAFALRMTDFEFELPLAREHFNENYVESHKYPTANFKGTLSGMMPEGYQKPGTYPVIVTGELTIHGITKTISEKGVLTVNGQNVIVGASVFSLRPEDYKIKVPRLVRDKVAEVVPVTVQVEFKPYPDGK